jgi:HlyD family secretion protein
MKIFVPIAVLLLLGLGGWKLLEWRNQPPEVSFTQATKGPIASEVSTNGRVDPSESAEAKSAASGRVERIFIKLKQNVAKDEVLAELDTSDLRHQLEVLAAQKGTEQAQLDVINAGAKPAEKAALDADIRRIDVDLANARRNYETEQKLLSQNAATRYAVEQAKQTVDNLEAQRSGLVQRLNSFVSPADRGPIEARMRELDQRRKQIESQMQQAAIRAPIAGTVFKFDLKPGAYLNPGDSIATIGKLNPVHVLVYVDEPDLGRVKKGMQVAITWEAMRDREWMGTVDRLPSEIQALDSRRVGEVLCVIDNPGLDLLPGTNVSARILSEQVSDAITIPKEAIFTKDGKPGVYMLEGDRIHWRAVTQGVNNVTRVQVKELKEGDTIALPSESATLTDGMQVRPAVRN